MPVVTSSDPGCVGVALTESESDGAAEGAEELPESGHAVTVSGGAVTVTVEAEHEQLSGPRSGLED